MTRRRVYENGFGRGTKIRRSGSPAVRFRDTQLRVLLAGWKGIGIDWESKVSVRVFMRWRKTHRFSLQTTESRERYLCPAHTVVCGRHCSNP